MTVGRIYGLRVRPGPMDETLNHSKAKQLYSEEVFYSLFSAPSDELFNLGPLYPANICRGVWQFTNYNVFDQTVGCENTILFSPFR